MNQFPMTTLSDVAFSQKIINRYQQGKRYPFSFPLMIFYKNIGPGLSLQMNVDLLVQLQLHTQKRGPFISVKNVQTVKRLSSWPGFEKLIPQCIITPALLQSVRSIHKIFSRIREATRSQFLSATQISVTRILRGLSIQSALSQVTDGTAVSATHGSVNRILRSLSMQSALSQVTDRTAVDTAFYPQAAYQTFLSGGIQISIARGGVLSRSQIPSGHSIPETSSRLWKAKPPSIYSHAHTLQSMQVNPFLLMGFSGRNVLTPKQGTPLLVSRTFLRNASGGIMEYLLPSLFSTYTSEVLNYREHVLGKWNVVRQTWGSKNNLILGLTKQYHFTQNERISQLLLSTARPVFYPQVTYQISSSTMKHHPPLKQGDYTHSPRTERPDRLVLTNVEPYSSIQKMKVAGHHSVSLLGNHQVLFNIHKGLFTRAVQNWMVVHKFFIKNDHNRFESGATDSITVRQRNTFETRSEHFYFVKQRKIEQEVDQIKKIVAETKEAMTERSLPTSSYRDMDINQHLDIHRISDQVYQNIERRIRMERERRGL